MSQSGSARRTTSLGGTSRLALSVGKASAPATATAGRHPLRHEWTISYMHRSPTVKVDYEKETKRVASFGSIESFLQLYTHLESPLDLQPVTDILIFQARISKPGIWEVMPDMEELAGDAQQGAAESARRRACQADPLGLQNELVRGGRFTFRLQHGITPLLYESALFALIGDQFDEAERVVGIVLSVRQLECLISIWVEEEGEAVKSGALRDKLLNLLNLPSTTTCEYRSNKTMLEAAASKEKDSTSTGATAGAGAIGSDGISGLPNGAGVNGTGNGYAAAPGGERDQRRTYHSNYNNHGHGHGHGHGNHRGERYSHRDNGDRDREHGDEDATAGRDGYTHGPGQGYTRGQSYRYNRDNRDNNNNRETRERRDRDRPEDLTVGSEDASASATAGGANGGTIGSGAGAGAATITERAERPAPLSARTSTGRFGQFSHTPLAAGSGPGFGRTDRAERGERAERGAWVRPRADL